MVAGPAPSATRAARRQACEQYFTASQTFSQRLRQVIGRPQWAQGLLGRLDLLPLNADDGMPPA
jgi:hypothetical protein